MDVQAIFSAHMAKLGAKGEDQRSQADGDAGEDSEGNRQEGGSLRVTPAMATGVVNRLMDIADLVAMLEEAGKKSVANNRR